MSVIDTIVSDTPVSDNSQLDSVIYMCGYSPYQSRYYIPSVNPARYWTNKDALLEWAEQQYKSDIPIKFARRLWLDETLLDIEEYQIAHKYRNGGAIVAFVYVWTVKPAEIAGGAP